MSVRKRQLELYDNFCYGNLGTLGPAFFNEEVIRRLDDLGVGLLRINLSHTKAHNLAAFIDDFQKHTNKPICLDTEGATLRVNNVGYVGRNKAVTVDRDIALAPLTDNDRACLAIGMEKNLNHFALSFASCQGDVEEIKKLMPEDTLIISKIEFLSGWPI